MPTPEKLSLILLSSDPLFHEELRPLLGRIPFLTVAAEIRTALSQLDAGARQQLDSSGPGYVMVDVDPAREDALRLIAQLAERQSALKVVAFSREVSGDMVLEVIRSGAAEFIPKPAGERVLLEALQRIRRQFLPRAETKSGRAGRVLAFFGTKGGSGATTVACNAAVSLARSTGKSVLLVDLDLQLGELALFLGLKPKYTVLDLVANLHRADEALLKTFVLKHESGVHLLPGPDSPGIEGGVGGEQVRKALQFLKAHYDFVVVDIPNNYYDYLVAALDQADQLFLVCTADLPSLKNVQRALAVFKTLGLPKDRLQVILNRYEKSDTGIDRGAVERIVGGKVFWSIPNDYPTAIRAINSGIPLASSNHTEISRNFAGLAGRIGGERSGKEHPAARGPFRFLPKKP